MSKMAKRSTASYNQQRQGAIFLNNTATTLFERRCYQEAMDLFKDAIHLMKSAFATDESSEELVTDSNAKVSACLQKASHYLIRSSSANFTTDKPHASPPSPSVTILSDGMAVEAMFSSIKAHATEPSAAYVVRIDTDAYDFEPSSVLDLNSATIIYNYGVVARCFQQNAFSNGIRGMKRDGAFTLFNLSYSIISRLLTKEGNLDNGTVSSLYLVSMLLIDDIQILCVRYNKHETFDHLRQLKAWLEQVHVSSIKSMNFSARAAPAA